MSATITFDPVLVETGSDDSDGRLAYRDGRLIGVLTRLDPDLHGDLGLGRHWFLEAGFGPVADGPRPPTFATLDEACAWLAARAAPVTRGCAAGRSPSAGWSGIVPVPPR